MVHLLGQQQEYINQDHRRIAEVLNEWDPTLELLWIPPEQRTGIQPAFAIRQTPTDGREPYIVTYVQESELDHRIIERLFYNDTTRHDVAARLEREEIVRKALEKKKHDDEIAEQAEFMATVLKSPLHTYRHDGKVYR